MLDFLLHWRACYFDVCVSWKRCRASDINSGWKYRAEQSLTFLVIRLHPSAKEGTLTFGFQWTTSISVWNTSMRISDINFPMLPRWKLYNGICTLSKPTPPENSFVEIWSRAFLRIWYTEGIAKIRPNFIGPGYRSFWGRVQPEQL